MIIMEWRWRVNLFTKQCTNGVEILSRQDRLATPLSQ